MVFNLRTFSVTESIEDEQTHPKSFSKKELQAATHNFSRNHLFAGGEFVVVYWGRLADGSLVAVNRAVTVDQERKEAFKREVQVRSSVLTHPKVLGLRGFCRTKKELFLVYPLMIHYRLAYHSKERSDWSPTPLNWTTRKRIALGAVRGLVNQLNSQNNDRILNRRFCLPSILLNALLKFEMEGPDSANIMHVGNLKKGTVEWHTLKNDVFVFGKTLLHLICGQKSMELGLLADDNPSFKKWIGQMMNENKLERVIDPNLQGHYAEEEAKQLVRLALSCVETNPSVRPEMSQVVRMLNLIPFFSFTRCCSMNVAKILHLDQRS